MKRGIFIGALTLIALGSLFIVGVLVAIAIGAQLSDNPAPYSRWLAIGLLAVIAVLVFVSAMARRWKRKHAE